MNRPRIVAHRGASAYAVDNTLTSFRMAAEMGADMIELDIRRSLDDKAVVFHDALIPMPGMCDARIESLNLESLLNVPLPNNERIPSFESVLDLCHELNMGIYVELKDTTDDITRWVVDELRRADLLDRSVIFGPRPDHVFFAKLIAPDSHTAFSYRQPKIDPILMARACNANGLNLAWEDHPKPHTLITPELLVRVRNADLRIMSWHEERESELRALITLGIDDICTNDPGLAHWLMKDMGIASSG